MPEHAKPDHTCVPPCLYRDFVSVRVLKFHIFYRLTSIYHCVLLLCVCTTLLYETARRVVSLVRIQSSVGEYKYTLHSLRWFWFAVVVVVVANAKSERLFAFMCACVFVSPIQTLFGNRYLLPPRGCQTRERARLLERMSSGGFFVRLYALANSCKNESVLNHPLRYGVWLRIGPHISAG